MVSCTGFSYSREMPENPSVCARLKEMRTRIGYSMAEMSRKLGFGAPSSYQYYEDDKSFRGKHFDFEFIQKLKPVLMPKGIPEADIDALGPPGSPISITAPLDDDFLHIDMYDIDVSAGSGKCIEEETIIGSLAFRRSWLRKVTNATEDQLKIGGVDGDSMEPTLFHGDTIMFDFSQRQFSKDGIYAIRYDGDVQVKRVSLNPSTKTVSVISDNPRYPSYHGLSPESVDIIAKIIWSARRM